MLDDPLNLACAMRELQRRSSVKIAGPVIPRGTDSLVYPTFRELLRRGIPTKYPTGAEVDSAAEIFYDGEIWFISIQDNEAGPYDSKARAIEETETLLRNDGWLVIEKHPWEDDDAESFPMGR